MAYHLQYMFLIPAQMFGESICRCVPWLHVMPTRTVSDARIPCATSTRDDLRALKRGDIVTYDDLFQRMIEQYNPEQAARAVEE